MSKYLILLDSAICFMAGALLFFAPHIVAQLLFNEPTDGVHWHLLRCIGGQKLTAAFILLKLRNSPIEYISASNMIRIMGLSLSLLILLHSLSTNVGVLVLQSGLFLKYWWSAWLIICVLMQMKVKWAVGTSMNGINNIEVLLYQLDTLASVLIGAAWLSFPKWLLSRQVNVLLSESHELCARIMGSYFLTSYIASTRALHWTDAKYRLIAIDSRALMCVSILAAQVWSQYAYEDHWNGGHWVGISLFSTWTLTSVLYRFYILYKSMQKSGKMKMK